MAAAGAALAAGSPATAARCCPGKDGAAAKARQPDAEERLVADHCAGAKPAAGPGPQGRRQLTAMCRIFRPRSWCMPICCVFARAAGH
ncbi:hypothetical protein ACFODQ_00125 [Comamonas sp. JC664]